MKEWIKVSGSVTLLLFLLGLWHVTNQWTTGHIKNLTSSTGSDQRKKNKSNLSPYEVKKFHQHLKTRFPPYRPHFQEAGKRHNIPWTLLAALAYQESHWNRKAKSPTGVRGIMMLTRTTAASLGITNRLDPVQSIHGGAKYLARLQKRIAANLPRPDKTLITLAAYNVGPGHLADAQHLASRLNKDPERWDELKQVLPLLAKKQYYKSLRHGYARGWEPVHYVQRIRAYQLLLKSHA